MRERLTEAARAQLREGGPMTVQAVAARARVSRATAYRHFLSNDAVLLWATRPVEGEPLLPAPLVENLPGESSLADRAEALIRTTARWAFEHERELRAVLAVSLTATRPSGEAPLRKGRMQRGRWIDDLLTGLPATVAPATRARLAAALTPLFGADAVVWTRDAADRRRRSPHPRSRRGHGLDGARGHHCRTRRVGRPATAGRLNRVAAAVPALLNAWRS